MSFTAPAGCFGACNSWQDYSCGGSQAIHDPERRSDCGHAAGCGGGEGNTSPVASQPNRYDYVLGYQGSRTVVRLLLR